MLKALGVSLHQNCKLFIIYHRISFLTYFSIKVWLLLKSSDFVSHDLTQPYKDTEDVLELGEDFSEPNYFLVLRTWVDINPGRFRCPAAFIS